MTIVISALQYLGYVLIFPGFLFCFLAGMLLCGIDRKIVARMQKRVGPPVLQPFYDFFKLLGVSDVNARILPVKHMNHHRGDRGLCILIQPCEQIHWEVDTP